MPTNKTVPVMPSQDDDQFESPVRVTGPRARIASTELVFAAVEYAGEGVVITDTDGSILYVNPAFERITGYSSHEAIGRNPSFLQGEHRQADFYRNLWETVQAGQVWAGRFTNCHKDGQLYQIDATIAPIRDVTGTIIAIVAMMRSVTA